MDELALLHDVLDDAAENRPAVVCVDGKTGTGKSTLLRHHVREARAAGFTILIDGHRPEVQHGLFRIVKQLGRRGPVLVAVDDVDRFDPVALRSLAFLRRRLTGLPVVLLLTRTRKTPESSLLDELVDGAVRITLTGLDHDGCAELTGTVFPDPAPELVADFHHLTAGNPYLLTELLRVLRDHDEIPFALKETPPELDTAVLTLAKEAGQDAIALLRAVAVLGTVRLPLAAAVADIDGQAAANAARTLEELGFRIPGELIDFSCPALRTALENSVTPLERIRAHTRAAEFLHHRQAPLREIAGQLLGTTAINQDWVQDVLLRAARQSMREDAPVRAIGFLHRLLGEPLSEQLRAEVLVELGEAHSKSDPAASLSCLAEAAAMTAVDASVRRRLATAMTDALAGRELHAQTASTLDSAIATVADTDPDLAQRFDLFALCLEFEESYHSPAVERRVGRLLEGPKTSERNKLFLNAALAYQAAMVGTRSDEALTRVQTVRMLAPQRQLTEGAATDLVDRWSLFYLVGALVAVDELELAGRYCAEALEHAEERNAAVVTGLVRGLKCHVSARLGALGDAESLGLAALRQLDALSAVEEGHLATTVAGLVGAWVDSGETGPAVGLLRERHLDGDLPEFSHYHAVLHQRGRLRTALGHHEEALLDHLECGRRMEQRGAHNPAVHPWRSYAALAYLNLGRKSEAFPLIEEELELAGKWGTATALGVALRAAGLVVGGYTGNSLLADSVSALRESPVPVELATSLTDWGVALRDAGRRVEARSTLRRAHALAKHCGAAGLMGRAARELRGAGGRPAAKSGPAGPADPAVLTTQEREVARRAAAGLTNRKIADELDLTQRTVELHLTQAYRKLGIPGRQHLADALTGADGPPNGG
jgi:DNA-binding CsgD family transcriptional regulator